MGVGQYQRRLGGRREVGGGGGAGWGWRSQTLLVQPSAITNEPTKVEITATSGAVNPAKLYSPVMSAATAGGAVSATSNMEVLENADTAEATCGMLVSSDTSGRSMRGVTCRSRGSLPTFGPLKACENWRPTSMIL